MLCEFLIGIRNMRREISTSFWFDLWKLKSLMLKCEELGSILVQYWSQNETTPYLFSSFRILALEADDLRQRFWEQGKAYYYSLPSSARWPARTWADTTVGLQSLVVLGLPLSFWVLSLTQAASAQPWDLMDSVAGGMCVDTSLANRFILASLVSTRDGWVTKPTTTTICLKQKELLMSPGARDGRDTKSIIKTEGDWYMYLFVISQVVSRLGLWA